MALPTRSECDMEEDGKPSVLPSEDASLNIWPNAEDEDLERAFSREDTNAAGKPEPKHASDKAVSVRSSALRRTVTGRSTASWPDPGPPPDGGRVAWTQACLLHLTTFNTFGVRAARNPLPQDDR